MDDPTKGVDIQTKRELYDLVKRMCERGVSVIWSSSEDRELLEAAHRVLVMREGRVVADLKGEKLNAYELYNTAL
jgi:ribose transport system ATP-binding protein